MSVVDDLVTAYRHRVALPWRDNLSPAERVWIAVYPPEQERRLRARLDLFQLETEKAGHGWEVVDLTDAFGRWLDAHEYRDAFLGEPELLTAGPLADFESGVVATVRAALDAAGSAETAVVALLGTGALYPFLRASRVIEAVESAVRGRLLVLFPGSLDGTTYRLLNARDGWNYRAIPITPMKDAP